MYKYMDYEFENEANFVNDVARHSLEESEKLRLKNIQFDEEQSSELKSEQRRRVLGAARKSQPEKFQAQIHEIIGRYGSLEDMRAKLKMSRREICDLLMVDQSAWSRWVQGTTQGEIGAPPHVYRTLALIFENKQSQLINAPDTVPPSTIISDPQAPSRYEDLAQLELKMRDQYASQIENMRERLEMALKQNEKFEILKVGWKIILIINTVLVLYVLFR